MAGATSTSPSSSNLAASSTTTTPRPKASSASTGSGPRPTTGSLTSRPRAWPCAGTGPHRRPLLRPRRGARRRRRLARCRRGERGARVRRPDDPVRRDHGQLPVLRHLPHRSAAAADDDCDLLPGRRRAVGFRKGSRISPYGHSSVATSSSGPLFGPGLGARRLAGRIRVIDSSGVPPSTCVGSRPLGVP